MLEILFQACEGEFSKTLVTHEVGEINLRAFHRERLFGLGIMATIAHFYCQYIARSKNAIVVVQKSLDFCVVEVAQKLICN